MCAGAIAHARIGRLYYAAADPKGGAVEHGPRLFGQPTCHTDPNLCRDRRGGRRHVCSATSSRRDDSGGLSGQKNSLRIDSRTDRPSGSR